MSCSRCVSSKNTSRGRSTRRRPLKARPPQKYLQHFTSAVRGDDLSAAQRIQIYRNNYQTSLRGALKAVYPVVARLVGEGFFAWLGYEFLTRCPSRSGNLHEFGAELADFIESFEAAKPHPFLPDVARLEWAWHEAFHEQEHPPLDLSRPGGSRAISARSPSISVAPQYTAAEVLNARAQHMARTSARFRGDTDWRRWSARIRRRNSSACRRCRSGTRLWRVSALNGASKRGHLWRFLRGSAGRRPRLRFCRVHRAACCAWNGRGLLHLTPRLFGEMSTMSSAVSVPGIAKPIIEIIEEWGLSVVNLGLRLYLAEVFSTSGMTKIQS